MAEVHPGQRYGTLKVIEYAGKVPGGSNRRLAHAWNCRCDCGEVEVIPQGHLTGGSRRRCVKCWRKKITELGISEEGLLPGGAIPRPVNFEVIDRRTKSGFILYWNQARHQFFETFDRVFSEAVAIDEWRKLFPKNQIKGER